MKNFLLLGILAAFLSTGCTPPDDLTVTIEVPTQVKVDETFELIVTIKNVSTELQTLTSIDVGQDYLEGIVLEESTPSYVQSWDFDLLGFMSYDYGQEIPAGGSLEIIYLMRPVTPGDYSGDLDVCINTGMDCIYNVIRTIVE